MAKPSVHRSKGNLSKVRSAFDQLVTLFIQGRKKAYTMKQLRKAVSQQAKGVGDPTILNIIRRLCDASVLSVQGKLISLSKQFKSDFAGFKKRAEELIFPTGRLAAV